MNVLMNTNIHKEMEFLEVCQTTNDVLNKMLDEELKAYVAGWFQDEQSGRRTQTDRGPLDNLAPCQHLFLLGYPVPVPR